MQIPDAMKLSESSSNLGSRNDASTAGEGSNSSPDSPTVVRTSSSTMRRQQAAAAAAAQVDQQPVLPKPGEAVGTFVLEDAIGVGGMGAVFRALDVQLDRHVALKLLPPDQTGDPEIVQRFYQEGRSAAQLDHENIARVYSIGQDGSHHYIAFEYIEGITVRRQVDEKGPLPVGQAIDITLQIAQALVHAASRGVVHRDIKPSNIILTPQGRAKLVDMGLARRFERDADRGLTQSGMTLGTFDYISPEQARDPRDVDVRSDLYSLGCTMFHMLTGRPPFPGGTVLQKLLQHQEEPPPEIRGLNSSVPDSLSRIIGRLLAKDRDRRYQSPEQLVRDLLVIAGQLGVPVIAAEQHAWITTPHRVTWERHLIWFFPALAFCVVLSGLVWWGREANGLKPGDAGLASTRPLRTEVISKVRSPAAPGQAPVPLAGEGDEPTPPVAMLPRNIPVRSADDLLNVIATAPPRAIISLADDGPYRLGGRTLGSRGPLTLINRDVTIKADPGYHPVLSFAADALQHDGSVTALLNFSGGTILIEGLTFELERAGPDVNVAAISTEDTDLTVRGCLFRQATVHSGRNRTALRARTTKATLDSNDHPPRVFADTCHFDGGQSSVVAQGPADILLRNCTLGPGSPSIWIDNSKSTTPVPAVVRLWNSSLMAGSGPVIEIEGALARIQADGCVIASSGNAQPTLVAVDNPRNLSWRGRSNLYSRLRAYLQPSQKLEGAEEIVDFQRWAETATEVREADTSAVPVMVWKSAHPLQQLLIEQEDPSQSFLLADEYARTAHFGAWIGPHGSRLIDPLTIASSHENPRAPSHTRPPDRSAAPTLAATEEPPRSFQPARMAANGPNPGGLAPATPPGTAAPLAQGAREEQTNSLPVMPPMTNAPEMEAGQTTTTEPPRTDSVDSPSRAVKHVDPATKPTGEAEAPALASVTHRTAHAEQGIRSTEQFLSLLKAKGNKGGTFKIAHDADLELPATELVGSGPWRIEAEPGPGPGRPRIRFRPSVFASRPPIAWSVLFNLHSGSLHLQGLDIILPGQDPEAPPTGPQAAIGVSASTRLELTHCTITVANDSASSAAIVVQPGAAETPPIDGEKTNLAKDATITITDTFIRSTGDCMAVSSGRLLDLRLQNVIVGTDGSLLHAMGSSQIDRNAPALRVKIDHSLTRNRGGLVFLESTQDEKELPLTEIDARRSTFSTAGPSPLLRLDGQGPMDNLRDRIVWKTDRVAYDQITTYRRDQILQTGVSPRDYSRSDWRTAFDPKDESPLVDGIKYLHKLELWRSARSLTREDVKLAPRSLAADRSPDLSRIPDAPPAES